MALLRNFTTSRVLVLTSADSLTLRKVARASRKEQADDESKQSQDGAENFDDQDLDEPEYESVIRDRYSEQSWYSQAGISSICEGGTTSVDTD